MRSSIQLLDGFFQDLRLARKTIFHLFSEAKHLIAAESRATRVFATAILVSLCLLFLLVTCNLSNSLALTAFTHLITFDLLFLLVALTSIWTKRKPASLLSYTLGYERFEVVAVFAATILAILSSFFEIKEAVERIFEPPEVYPGYLLLCPLALIVHIITIYGIENPAFSHVILASGSSWLQEHATDISRTLCGFIPGLSRILLPRVNPFSLVGVSASSVVFTVYWAMTRIGASTSASVHHHHGSLPDPLPDTIGGVVISLMLSGTMVPMMLYSGRILLQTVPAHMVGPLDKAFREASTIDGVLELRNEHVWSIGFGSLAGTVYVRVRRDADEQLVLAHVTNRLSSLVKYLTVQVYKDDWTRKSTALSWLPGAVGIPVPNMPSRTLLQKDAHLETKASNVNGPRKPPMQHNSGPYQVNNFNHNLIPPGMESHKHDYRHHH
ncbi:hypothetical protein CRM22_006418 [Opisthorchis felineus]|uniref:Cation efflux protein transmembrane domain-containing protein n=1 Tax=Opisthorchis felineus TaxID=147828 RepID=A0A4S2LL24_OPIFE|nr:hypothetical protein CRM22_006418 [Opisthorchis felineus]